MQAAGDGECHMRFEVKGGARPDQAGFKFKLVALDVDVDVAE